MGDHRVGQRGKGVMGQQNSYLTVIVVHEMHIHVCVFTHMCVYLLQGVSSLRSLSPCTCVEVFEWYG